MDLILVPKEIMHAKDLCVAYVCHVCIFMSCKHVCMFVWHDVCTCVCLCVHAYVCMYVCTYVYGI